MSPVLTITKTARLQSRLQYAKCILYFVHRTVAVRMPEPASHADRDCNPGLEFSIPEFGIVEFPIPGSRRDWRTIVQTSDYGLR